MTNHAYMYLTPLLFLPQQPDIAAPGASILAAMRDSYKFDTGTSMAAPHVSGIVALLKSLHPDWSPAALKSVIVTTGKYVSTTINLPLIYADYEHMNSSL